jgi:tetratricopeptide (TPR) repeat protein
MTPDVSELVARLMTGELTAESRWGAIAFLACDPLGADAENVLHLLAGTADPVRIEPCAASFLEPARDRRWKVPVALRKVPGEGIDGISILHENDDATGVLLWLAFRDVCLWSSAAPDERAELFSDGVPQRRFAALAALQLPAHLDVWLTVLTAVPRYPTQVSPPLVALAALELSNRFAEEAKHQTALAFARAAAAAVPSAVAAYATGVAALRLERTDVADTWFRRAHTLARRSRNWETYGAALLQLGNLALLRGDVSAARTAFEQGFRTGQRRGMSPIRSRAMSGLFRVAKMQGELAEAEGYALEAIRLLGRAKLDAVPVQLELAEMRIEMDGGVDALPLLHHVLQRDSTSLHYRAVAQALVAHVAAVRGDFGEYRRAWMEAASLASGFTSCNVSPAAKGRVAVMLVRAALVANDPRGAGRASRLCSDAEQCDRRSIEIITDLLRTDSSSPSAAA